MSKPLITGGPGSIDDNAQALARALFRGDLSETQVKALHPQALHFAIKALGLESALDVLSSVSNEQYRSLLDFELWTRDSFREDRFWAWLSVVDSASDLQPLQKFLKAVDPVSLSLLLKRHVEIEFFEEIETNPPNPNAYTPDGGLTWVTLKAGNPDIHRMLGRILAFLYQSNRELFYQQLSYSTSGTNLEFEEEAYQEKTGRLKIYSIPSSDEASSYQKILSLKDFIDENKSVLNLEEEKEVEVLGNVDLIPLPINNINYQPLLSCLERLEEDEVYRVQLELALLFNSNLIHFSGDYGEEKDLKRSMERVIGVVNIGLELVARENNNILSNNVFKNISLKSLYRLGLSEIYSFRSLCQKVPEDVKLTLSYMNQALSLIVTFGSSAFPSIPKFLREDGTFDLEGETVSGEESNIYSLDQIRAVKSIVQKQIHDKLNEIRSYEKQHKKHELVRESTSKDVQ